MSSRVIGRGVLAAFVVVGAFGLGVAVGQGGGIGAVIRHIPLVGDGLDATPADVDLSDFWKAWNALGTDFVQTHASSTLPTGEEKLWGAIKGLAASYGDPYTVFFPPSEAKIFEESISGNFGGVGMEIGIKNDVLTVISPLKGTPAERAGVKAGDLIIAIDGASTEGLSVDEAVAKIRGPKGTSVKLDLARASKPFELSIVRDTIEVPETEDGIDTASGVYHIAIYEFASNAPDLFNQALARFKTSGSTRLVLDLRGDPGGYLEAAVDIGSHFLPRGATIVTEDFDGKDRNVVHTSSGYEDLPAGTKVAVLIDQGSASASEILAGALQDNHAATLVGTRSFGKGSVQQLVKIGDASLKITVAKWLTPSGRSISDGGLTPDVAVERTQADADAGKDPQMARAIEFLTTGK